MSPAESIRIGRSFVGVLDRNRRLKPLCQANLMERVNEQISPEAVAGDHQPENNLRKVESLPKTHLFDSFHPVIPRLGTRVVASQYGNFAHRLLPKARSKLTY